MKTSSTWWRKNKISSATIWVVILMIFTLYLSCVGHSTTPKNDNHGGLAKPEVDVDIANRNTTINATEECEPVDHGEGRGGMRCLGCSFSGDPAPKNCDIKRVYECHKGEVCYTYLQKSDSGKGHIQKGCTRDHKGKQFNKWIKSRSTALGDIQSKTMICNETDCCNASDDPYGAAGSFKASLLITFIMIMFTKCM